MDQHEGALLPDSYMCTNSIRAGGSPHGRENGTWYYAVARDCAEAVPIDQLITGAWPPSA